MRAAWLFGLLALGLCLSGCSGMVWPDQPQAALEPLPWLESGHAVGQTFTALEGGLTGIEIYLAPDPMLPPAPAAEIELWLRSGLDASEVLAEVQAPLSSITQPGFVRFAFAPQPASLRKDYYVELQLAGEGRVQVGQGPGAAYWSGAMYVDREPVDAQMAFRLVYAPAGVGWGVLGGALRFVGWLALGLLLVAVPGVALLAWVWPASMALSWGERLGLAVAVGAAVYPLLFLWTDVVGAHWGAVYAWLPVGAGATALGVWVWRRRPALRAAWGRAGVRAWWQAHGWADLALAAVVGAVFFTRWWAARSLDLPLWGDSLQHTMIVQLLLDHGGLFDHWAPYAELESFTYHFGFHSLVAAFNWLGGLPAPQATVWMGQILNGLAVLALYPLGVQMSGNRWGGVAAVLVAGLLSPYPAYFINWGRYTQLAGQLLLPAAVYLTWALTDGKRRTRGVVVLAVLVVAGLALTHYRVLLMYGCFTLALMLVQGRAIGRVWRPMLALALGTGLLALPQLLASVGGPLLAFTQGLVTTPASNVSQPIADFNSPLDLRAYPWILGLLVAAGIVSGLIRRRGPTMLVLAWWVLLLVLANPAQLGLPGTGLVNNFAVMLSGYIGAGILVAAGAAWLSTAGARRWWPAWLALALVVSGAGFRQQLRVVEAGRHMLAGRADMRAAEWIDGHLPAEARLLVNSFFAYSGTVLVSGDAGVWLPLLARRAVTVPPITYASERGPGVDYRTWVKALPTAIREHGLNAEVVQAMLRERGITHVYIGQQQAQTGGGEPFVLKLAELLASPYFRPVYHEDRVWVFEVLPPRDGE